MILDRWKKNIINFVKYSCPRAAMYGFGLYTITSLLSYNVYDNSLNTLNNNKVTNLGGQLGAYISDVLIQYLGISCFFPLIFCFLPISKKFKALKLLAIVINLILISILLSFMQENQHYGGSVGYKIAHYFISSDYNNIYTILTITITILLNTTFIFYKFAKKEYIHIDTHINPILQHNEDQQHNITSSIIPSIRKGRNRKENISYPSYDSTFQLPQSAFLTRPKDYPAMQNNYRITADQLETTLNDFHIKGQVTEISHGPVVTLYELLPAAGTKSSRVIGLSNDISRSMSTLSARIAIIPGKNTIGIELPNEARETVFLRPLLESDDFHDQNIKLPLALGKNIYGNPVIADLAKMPHLLIAGTTGSGKSVSLNAMILSLVYRLTPQQCKLIMIDPKMLELSSYGDIPHLITPVVTEAKKSVMALKWVVKEMENRYRLMTNIAVRNIEGFNAKMGEAISHGEQLTKVVQTGFNQENKRLIFEEIAIKMEQIPYIVVIVDEMADLMLTTGKEIEALVQRLAQMGRAAGIHVITATQRPSVDVITGVIKANFPTRISFAVTSKIDSRTILGEQGAEQLLGMGDMLYMPSSGCLQRIHGPFVSDDEVMKIADFLRSQGDPQYIHEVIKEYEEGKNDDEWPLKNNNNNLYDQAVEVIQRDRKISISYIQRKLSIGYNRVANIIERMEEEGIITQPNHTGKRSIIE